MSQLNEEYASLIRSRGHRLTPQRQIIYDTLAELGKHITAMELTELVQVKAPSVNRATIYRTLDFLHKMQLVTVTEIGKDTVYEVLEDVPHHHLVCRECGKMEMLDDYHLQHLVEHLLEEHLFQAEIHHMTITGLCNQCQELSET
jgi:Fur family ferric uptake transcriptional regulator